MGLAGRRNGGAADGSHDDEEAHGLPCVPDANAVGADARWYHSSRAGIKRFLSTGDQGPGYSKLETTTAAQPDWRDVDAAFVSLLFDLFPCLYIFLHARPPNLVPPSRRLFQASRHCIVLLRVPPLHSLSLHWDSPRHPLCKTPLFFVAVQLFHLSPKLPQLVFRWPTDDFSDSHIIPSEKHIQKLPALTLALSSWSLLAPVRCS
jgi:hypothetical protein